MKKFSLYICTLLVATLTMQCVDEDKLLELSDFETGALPNFTQTANDDGFVDLLDIPNSQLEFTIDLRNDLEQDSTGKVQGSGRLNPDLEFSEVSSIDIEVMWTNSDHGTRHSAIIENVSTWPATITVSPADLSVAFDPGVLPADSFELGDQLQFTAGFNMQDGRQLPGFVRARDGMPTIAYSANIINQIGLNYNLIYLVSCASDLAGNYTAELVASNQPPGTFVSPLDVTVTGSNGVYTISDGTMDIFGNFPIGLAFTEICGTITVTPASVGFPTQVIFTQGAGTTYDQNTGVITFDLAYDAASCCGLPGATWTFTATPK